MIEEREGVTVNDHDDSIEIDLKRPLHMNGEELLSISLRRPTVDDLERMDKAQGAMSKGIMISSYLSGLPPKTIRQMDAADFKVISEVIADFLE